MSINVTTRPQGEARLIALAKDGDEQAFEGLFHAYEGRAYSLCVRMTGDLSEAEDLAQETFLQLFRRISTFREEESSRERIHREEAKEAWSSGGPSGERDGVRMRVRVGETPNDLATPYCTLCRVS